MDALLALTMGLTGLADYQVIMLALGAGIVGIFLVAAMAATR